jgi:hypothetical protein
MDAQLRAKWVEALRSKKYRQVQGNLREETSKHRYGYCCLGVLCHTMGSRWKDGTPMLDGKRMEHEQEAYLSYEALLMADLGDVSQRRLAEMNDAGNSFAEIADYIETNL